MRAMVFLAVLTAACAPSVGPSVEPSVEHGGSVAVVDVIDGDTIRVVVDHDLVDVRLLGINSPEWAECLGPEAAARLEDLVGDRTARLVADRSDVDQYGRLLRLVFSDGTLVNETLVRAGLALAYPVPPDLVAAGLLAEAEATAEESRIGLWAREACGPAPPSDVIIGGLQSGAGWTGEPVEGESVLIGNEGTAVVELTEWVLRDASSAHRYTFPTFELGGSQQVTVATGCGRDRGDLLHWCADNPVWNDDGDHALLLDDHGNIVDHLRY